MNLAFLLTPLLLILSLFHHLEWLCFFAFIPLIHTIERHSKNYYQSFLYGFFTQFIFYLFAFHWTFYSFKSYFQFSNLVAGSLTIFICLLGSIHWGVSAALLHFLGKQDKKNTVWKQIIFFLVAFSVLNFIVFQFFPMHFGFHFYKGNLPGKFLSRIIGWQGLGILCLFINALLYQLFKKRFRIGIYGFACMLIILFITQYFLMPISQRHDHQLRFIGVQAAISNEDKRSDLQKAMLKMDVMDQYYNLTRQGLKTSPADFIIWPETAIPSVWHQGQLTEPLQNDFYGFLNDINTPILSGGYLEDDGLRNSVFLFSPGQEHFQYSTKQKLFPLGEYIPFNDFGGLTKNYFPDVPRFKNDSRARPLSIRNNLNVYVPICYEILFDNDVLAGTKNSQIIISISNDSWFESDLQKEWHAAISFSRSVELGIPVLRVTNDGVSGFANYNGLVSIVDKNKPKVFSGTIDMKENSETIYKKYGEWIQAIPHILSIMILLYYCIIFSYKNGFGFRKSSQNN